MLVNLNVFLYIEVKSKVVKNKLVEKNQARLFINRQTLIENIPEIKFSNFSNTNQKKLNFIPSNILYLLCNLYC